MKIPPQLAGEGLSLATKCRRLPLLLPTPNTHFFHPLFSEGGDFFIIFAHRNTAHDIVVRNLINTNK